MAGGDGAATSSDEDFSDYRIVSTAFTQARLRDQDGDGLRLRDDSDAAFAGMASLPSRPSMLLRVPTSTYGTITHDHDPSKENSIQVPIYLYTGREWRYAGPATLEDSAGNKVGEDDYSAYVDTDDDHKIKLNAPAWPTPLFARLEIDEGNDWVSWVNIDWPILAGQISEQCVAAANIAYDGDEPTPFVGYVNLTLPDGGRQWIYVSDGKLAEVIPAGSDEGWEARVRNNRTNRDQVLADLSVTLNSSCVAPDEPDHLLANPNRCRLSGSLVRGEDTVAGRRITASGVGFWDSTFSDDDGEFHLDVPCDVDLTLRTGNKSIEAKVDGVVGDDEIVDDGTRVTVEIDIPPQPPQISVRWPQTLTVGREGRISFYAWDPDGDDITVRCTEGCEYEQSAVSSLASRINFTPTSPGPRTITLQASDEHGASASVTRTIEVESLNRAPRITRVSATANDETRDLSCHGTPRDLNCRHEVRTGSLVTYRVFAHDPDGDPINFEWDWDGGITTVASVTDEQNLLVNSDGQVSVTATDEPSEGDAASAKGQISVVAVEARPPQILYAYLSPNVVTLEDGKNSQPVNLVFAADYDFDDVSYSWSISGDEGLHGQNSFSRGDEVTLEVVEKGQLAAGSYTISLEIKGNYNGNVEKTTRNLGLLVTAGNVEVIVQ
ncbi:hypothetical protein LRD18_03045 [Halorhodospira halochloris]|uniref:Ig-like domain-containing protein n=1 Tax=Halorhodospira halochloris TaxID=1052 RepID=UPI001EE98FFA|nr:hypothetical protein [Halorhodospira halochloris]MCG5529851.1 hypothetical protein [Halorhodospira halochloris]